MERNQEKLKKDTLTLLEILDLKGYFTKTDELEIMIPEFMYETNSIKYHRYRYIPNTDYFKKYASYEVKN